MDPEGEIERLLKLAGARPQAPAEAEARVRAAVLTRWRSDLAARRRRKAVLWTAGFVAAAAVLLVLVLPALRRPDPGSVPEREATATLLRVVGSPRMTPPIRPAIEAGAALPEGTEIVTGPGDRAALRLADGTTLRVDRGTRIRLLAGRVVDLAQGAVYVETVEPARGARDLRIRTPLGTVRDVGTRFQVRLAETILTVGVRSGEARLERDGVAHEAGIGTQLVVQSGGAVASRSLPLHGPDWDWTLDVAPEFHIEGRSLGEFLDWTARESGFEVQFADPAMQPHAVATLLHGSVTGMRPEEALSAVLPTCGLRHTIQGDAIVIERAKGAEPSSPSF
jgi:ferric-dicitrate binding protein FerR (iron transport regulator)